MLNDIRRTCGFVHTSLSASARLVTVGSKLPGQHTSVQRDEEMAARLSPRLPASTVVGVRLNDRPNVSELLQTPSNPIEPKTLTGSSQKARSRMPHRDLGHTNMMTAGVETGTNSFVSSERNRINPSSRLVEAGVIARCAAGCRQRMLEKANVVL